MASPDTWAGKYLPQHYDDMVDDTARTEAYAQALREIVRDGDVVVDIGTGPYALLACQAAKAGAGQVFAIEVDDEVAESARQFLSASSDLWTAKIEVKHGASADVVIPTTADVVVHELIGLIAGCEGAAAILRDAFTRHVKQSPQAMSQSWSVPARARSWLVPVEIPTNEQLLANCSEDGYRQEPLPKDRLVTAIDNFPFASCAIAHPQYFEVLDFARLPSDPKALMGNRMRRLVFEIDRPGILAGFAIFITGEMTPSSVAVADAAETHDPASCCYFSCDVPAPGVGFCSAWQGSHWGNLVIRLNLVANVVHVERGDIIEVDATVDLTPFQPKYALRAVLQQQRGENVEYMEVLDGLLEQKQLHRNYWTLGNRLPACPQ